MLYYNKYNNSKLINNIYYNLPLDEFSKGNFSRAGEIIDQYSNLLQKCFSDAEKKYLGNQTMSGLILEKRKNLLEEKESLSKQKKELVDKMNNIKNIEKNKISLEKECVGDKKWEAIWKKFTEFDCDTEGFEYFLEELKVRNPDNYKEGKEVINNFLNSDNYKKIKEYGKIDQYALWSLEMKRNDITKKLSHKKNDMNVENQILKIEDGTFKSELEESIRNDVKEYFGKKRKTYQDSEDSRDLKTIYMETISSRIILNKNANNELRSGLIKNYNDKTGLWDFVWGIYNDLARQESDIRRNLDINDDVNIDLENGMRDGIIKEIKDGVDLCKESYFMRRDAVGEDDISYLEEKLKGEKKQSRNMEILVDVRAKRVFGVLKDYFEDNEIENMFEKIWNYSYQGISISCRNLENILFDLLKYMDVEDYTEVKEGLKDHRLFSKIDQKLVDKSDAQLELLFCV